MQLAGIRSGVALALLGALTLSPMVRQAAAQTPPAAPQAPQAPPAPAAPAATPAAAGGLTAADAAPFLGDWTIDTQGPNGAMPFALTVKVDGDKVVATLSSDIQPLTTITDIAKSDKSAVLNYNFDYQGSPVPTVLTLTPAADDKLTANFDFASGAYVMTGTGTKKPK